MAQIHRTALLPPTRGRRGQGKVVLIVLLAVLGAVVLIRAAQAFYDRLHPPEAVEAPPRLVRVVTLDPQPFEYGVLVAGTLEPVHSVDVFPKVGGKVVELYVSLGDRVREGAPLARVEATEWGLQAAQAEVGLQMAEQAAALASTSLGRLEQVHEKLGDGALSQQQFDEAAIQAEGAKTQQEVARLQRDLAQQMVKNATMRAPTDGVVSRMSARLGGMVGSQYPAFHVDDTASLLLRCEVGDRELPRVAVGQEVRLRSDALPGRDLVGTVTAVAPTLDSITRRGPVEIAVPNDDGRVIGNVFARGRIITGREEAAFVLPVEAVQRHGDAASVQLVVEGAIRARDVTVLGEAHDSVAVEGLEAGSLVVLPGPEHLAEGEAVQPVDVTQGQG
ncbi:MAG: efflux RND transporter periplasmic adaptor subunit [Pseudomonadota bacterium]